jgi:shikimate kinase
LVIAIPSKILDIKQYIVKIIESTIQEMFKDMEKIRIMKKEETITPSLPYKTIVILRGGGGGEGG